jgi:hypothetical protein
MLWSGSKPLTVVRENMWGFLLFAGVAWLAISWSVLRLEPADIVQVAGSVVLFGALTEGVRALAGTRTWWLNAGLAVLFAGTGGVLLTSADSSFTTPAALIGWYLMVRGAADVAVSMMTRETDRIWGLLMVVGVLETGLGFYAASPLSRTANLVVTVLGGLALVRGVADLVAGLRLREVSAVRAEVLELPPERAAGLAGYSAGRTDVDAAPAANPAPVRTGPRHRAAPRSPGGRGSVAGMSELSTPPGPAGPAGTANPADAAGSTGWAGTASPAGSTGWAGTASPAGSTGWAGTASPAGSTGWAGTAGAASPAGSAGWAGAAGTAGLEGDDGWSGTRAGAGGEGGPAGSSSFHDEVLRTTADLDAMLALAGVTGAGVAAGMAEHFEIPNIPDTAEGAESSSDPAEMAVPPHGHGDDRAPVPPPDPKARAAPTASPGMDETSIIAGGRLLD